MTRRYFASTKTLISCIISNILGNVKSDRDTEVCHHGRIAAIYDWPGFPVVCGGQQIWGFRFWMTSRKIYRVKAFRGACTHARTQTMQPRLGAGPTITTQPSWLHSRRFPTCGSAVSVETSHDVMDAAA